MPKVLQRRAGEGAARLGEESDPDGAPSIWGQVAVPQRDVDAGLECRVDRTDPVRREEENSSEVSRWFGKSLAVDTKGGGCVLKLAQEDCDERVALKVMQRSCLKEDIRLIDKHDRAPARCMAKRPL